MGQVKRAQDIKKNKIPKLAKDEVSLAWAQIHRAQAQSEDKSKGKEKKPEESKSEEKENLEEALIPQENFEFDSILPSKAPSLEITGAKQNLERTIGPFFGDDEEKEEKISYSSSKKQDKGYIASAETEEPAHYENFLLAKAEFADPNFAHESDMAKFAKRAAPMAERSLWEKEYIPANAIDVKELSHEKLDRERTESVKKYKAQM
jgi:hypothetical protein